MTEANFRRYGGHSKMPTTNGQGFVYVPYRYSNNGNKRYFWFLSPFRRVSTTKNTLRNIPRASIDKPPSIKPPGKFKLNKIDKQIYEGRKTTKKNNSKIENRKN